MASGEKTKARDILNAIRTLKLIEHERRALAKLSGFGPVALRPFPDPVTGQYKDHLWHVLGDELKDLLTADE